jgi:hypothetical protein
MMASHQYPRNEQRLTYDTIKSWTLEADFDFVEIAGCS